ncbi:dirigent protein 22-like [Ziziphus jujuba]|uniref:Dirigent protein n=1 Tax=Ziziphus jujuba TaxID=326968 RepID=A0A6P4AVK5_ZIZJJ|nr:dirigent protein 22-like [Ziziphus jujuba]
MANSILIFSTILLFLNLVTAQNYSFSRTLSPEELGIKPTKLTHLHFYFHDITEGPNSTVVTVAGAPEETRNTATFFGNVVVMDDPLTVGPELSSKLVGRAQGIYTYASQSDIGLLLVLNFIFMEGKYNGSTLSILGRNAILSKVREMPIVAGTGIFRFARGYVEARTYEFEPQISLNAIVEYNAYVYHY